VILVDTSVWVHYLRFGSAQLASLLNVNSVVMHPYIVGEIACGSLSKRAPTLELLQQLPVAPVAEFDEVLGYVEDQKLHGVGIGYVDVHLLMSAAIGSTKLWTRDRRLHAAAARLRLAYPDASAH
jgi:predicted nucleic acid-binding protein